MWGKTSRLAVKQRNKLKHVVCFYFVDENNRLSRDNTHTHDCTDIYLFYKNYTKYDIAMM